MYIFGCQVCNWRKNGSDKSVLLLLNEPTMHAMFLASDTRYTLQPTCRDADGKRDVIAQFPASGNGLDGDRKKTRGLRTVAEAVYRQPPVGLLDEKRTRHV